MFTWLLAQCKSWPRIFWWWLLCQLFQSPGHDSPEEITQAALGLFRQTKLLMSGSDWCFYLSPFLDEDESSGFSCLVCILHENATNQGDLRLLTISYQKPPNWWGREEIVVKCAFSAMIIFKLLSELVFVFFAPEIRRYPQPSSFDTSKNLVGV